MRIKGGKHRATPPAGTNVARQVGEEEGFATGSVGTLWPRGEMTGELSHCMVRGGGEHRASPRVW